MNKRAFRVLHIVVMITIVSSLCVLTSTVKILDSNMSNLKSLIISLNQNYRYNLKKEIVDRSSNDIQQLKSLEEVLKQLKHISSFNNAMKKKLNDVFSIDVLNVERIKEANVTIFNQTHGFKGSGTKIIINNKAYILSCAHLIKADGDMLCVKINNGDIYPLELVKYDDKVDLALYRIYDENVIPAMEISDVEPNEGSQLVVVGNPAYWEDIFTNGVLCKKTKDRYIFTNTIYFGNSGGAVLYRGKIVGVVSMISTYHDYPISISYGISTTLEQIKEFLKTVE